MKIQSVLMIILLQLYFTQGANILFFLAFSTYSHRITMWPLVESLIEKGHSVTVLQSFENKNPRPKVKDLVVHSKSLEEPDFLGMRLKYGPRASFMHTQSLPFMGYIACNETLSDPKIMFWINSNTVDLVIIDSLVNDCALGLAFKWKSKTIVFGTSAVLEYWPDEFGFPVESSWIPSMHYGYDIPLSFINRVKSTLQHLYFWYLKEQLLFPSLEPLLREKLNLPDLPPLIEISKNTSLVLMNTHYSEELARSIPPLVVPVGGMHCSEKKETLPKDLEEYLNAWRDKGFIYVSFGSAAKISKAPKDVQEAFFEAFHNSKFGVVWKWEGEIPVGMPPNVFLTSWVPQQTILAQPNIKAFITHGGLLSIQEAIFHGVPMIAFPIFAEQDYNAERLERTKRGIRLEIATFTHKQLEDAIHRISNDKIYKDAVMEASKLFKDRPQKPIDTATWWVEYVLRNKNSNSLRPLSVSQTWYQRRLLDVWAFIGAVLLFIIYIVIFIIKKVISWFFIKMNPSQMPRSSKIKKR